VRGGLDDALEKLARRDELRRRASGEATGTPPAVTELVEAIAAVVGRNPELGVTVGVEGAGDPMLLHFYSEDGVVQVNADNAIVDRAGEAESAAPRHADIHIEVGEPIEEPYSAPPAYEPGGETRRLSQDDQDRYGPATFGYPEPEDRYFGDSDTAERRYGSFDNPPSPAEEHYPGEVSRDLGARMRDLGMATRETVVPEYPPHPFAATPPPPVPPQTTRRIQSEQYHSPAEPSAAERAPQRYEPVPPQPERRAPEQRGGMPTPLPKPIPLQVERPEETEMAARRLAALLRDDPSLLNQSPD
jgi:hypothetical protein